MKKPGADLNGEKGSIGFITFRKPTEDDKMNEEFSYDSDRYTPEI
ncbi:MAG TPA: hypothetical protein VJ915_08285 [Balneolaceae bacterium]|nr:hypothetical protein [Balneolaceae bacterium]